MTHYASTTDPLDDTQDFPRLASELRPSDGATIDSRPPLVPQITRSDLDEVHARLDRLAVLLDSPGLLAIGKDERIQLARDIRVLKQRDWRNSR